MTFLQFVTIFTTVFLLSAGQVLFKIVSEEIVLDSSGLISSLVNRKLFAAGLIYAIATLLWIFSLKGLPLRIAYPFVGMAFFIVPMLSYFILGEKIGWNTFVGAIIILIGVFVSIAK